MGTREREPEKEIKNKQEHWEVVWYLLRELLANQPEETRLANSDSNMFCTTTKAPCLLGSVPREPGLPEESALRKFTN